MIVMRYKCDPTNSLIYTDGVHLSDVNERTSHLHHSEASGDVINSNGSGGVQDARK